MQFRYSLMRKSLSACTKHVAVVAGLVALPITAKLEKMSEAKSLPSVKSPSPDLALAQKPAADPRTDCLRKFFARLHCPVTNLSEEFVHAADDNQLDWRLLPSISVIESGGGKAYRNNNIFGWNNGTQLFPTIRAGLNEVAFRLGKSPLYRHRDLIGKLKLYNPDETYATSVINVMNRISPVADLKPARRLVRRQAEFVYVTD
jgi:hypothetical protein